MNSQQPPRYYRIAYSNIASDSNSKRAILHQVRDCIANAELGAALVREGYELGTTVHLLKDCGDPPGLLSELAPKDMLLLTTRPPLDDWTLEKSGVEMKVRRRRIPKNGGTLENTYMQALREYLAFCDRCVITLGPSATRNLPSDRTAYHDLEFSQYCIDYLAAFRKRTGVAKIPSHNRHTVAFFIRLPVLPGLPCGLITSFGMSGFTTLAWNRALRTRFPDWIATRRFVMAKLIVDRKAMDMNIMTPHFADDERLLRVEPLAEEYLDKNIHQPAPYPHHPLNQVA